MDHSTAPEGLHHGDNLAIMRGWPSACIDLTYMDPPFCTGQHWEGKAGAFSDRWEGPVPDGAPEIAHLASRVHSPAMGAYLAFMAPRLAEVRRLLKPTGSVWVHCDDATDGYVRVLVDDLFGRTRMVNRVSWKRKGGGVKGSQHVPRRFGRVTDTLFFYSKTSAYTFDRTRTYTKVDFPYVDEQGRRYRLGRGLFGSSFKGARPNLCYEYKGWYPPYKSGWNISRERMLELDNQGAILWRDGKQPAKKWFEGDGDKVVYDDDIWSDITIARGVERTGYPTQKPLKLLDRIIRASSNEGDVVLDPFCGSGTTLAAAEAAGRSWVGIDAGEDAVSVCEKRLAVSRRPK